MKFRPAIALVLFAAVLLAACGEKPPLKIGFVGGLSDRNSDVGQAGQNGVVLAIEQVNRAGGIDGRLLELVSRDDAQTADVARRSATELAEEKVAAVV